MLKVIAIGFSFLVLWWNVFGILVVTELGESWVEIVFWFILSCSYSAYFTKDLLKIECNLDLYISSFSKIFKHSSLIALFMAVFWLVWLFGSVIYDYDYFKSDKGLFEAALFLGVSVLAVVFLYLTQILVSIVGYFACWYVNKTKSSNKMFNRTRLRSSPF